MKKPKPIENIQFFLGGILLILGGVQNDDYQVIITFLILIGIALLLYSVYSIVTKRRHPVIKIIALGGELIALIAAALIFYGNGSNYLHFLYFLAAFGIAVALGIHSFKMYNNKNRIK